MSGPAQPRRVIGGDFELDQLRFGGPVELDQLTRGLAGRWTSSGRAALALILRRLKNEGVRHVHLPSYLCESLLLPVRALGLQFSLYPVDLSLVAQPDPPPGACALVIHYFGWLNPAVPNLRSQTGPRFHLIEDAAQALLSDWSAERGAASHLILSPRKFGPAVFGGWCNLTGEEVSDEAACDVRAPFWRALAARLARGAYLKDAEAEADPRVEEFYLAGLRETEAFLDQHPTCAELPQAALDQLAGVDWREAAARRRANWAQLHQLLAGRVEVLKRELPQEVVPLGYVVCLDKRDEVRARLASQRIFCPVHWPLPAEVERRRFPAAAALSDTCLTLPIDQRYGEADISRMAEALLAAL